MSSPSDHHLPYDSHAIDSRYRKRSLIENCFHVLWFYLFWNKQIPEGKISSSTVSVYSKDVKSTVDCWRHRGRRARWRFFRTPLLRLAKMDRPQCNRMQNGTASLPLHHLPRHRHLVNHQLCAMADASRLTEVNPFNVSSNTGLPYKLRMPTEG